MSTKVGFIIYILLARLLIILLVWEQPTIENPIFAREYDLLYFSIVLMDNSFCALGTVAARIGSSI